MRNRIDSRVEIRYQPRTFKILFCLIALVLLCICVYYSLPVLAITTRNSILVYSLKSRLSPELCFSSGNGVFVRDNLRELVIGKLENTSAYVNIADALNRSLITENNSNLTEFIINIREALMSRRLKPGIHSIPTIFRSPPYFDMVKPSCDGQWMEFGVFQGATLSIIANWKALYCGNASQPVYGFDTFKGLPTHWRSGFSRGTFSIANGTLVEVPQNTVLVKGLFIDTLPVHLRSMDEQSKCHTPVSFVHIDCDIYDGARDILFLLGSRLVPGSILVFDELFNYPTFEKHEIKAFYEFLSGSRLRLIPLGSSSNIDLNPTHDKQVQTFGFVVAPQLNQ